MNRTSLAWMGNKSRMVGVINRYMPNHRVYIEGFAGSLAVLLNKPKSEVEIINDLDRDLINYWENVKTNHEELVSRVRKMSEGFDVYVERERVGKLKTSVDRASHYVLVNRNVVMGDMSRMVPKRVTYDVNLLVDRIKSNSNCLKDVTIFNTDYMWLCEQFDGEAVFIFLDPPYHEFTEYRVGGFSEEDFINMAKFMGNTKSKVMVTINDDEFIRETFKDFVIVEVEEGRINGGKRMDELIVMNYEL